MMYVEPVQAQGERRARRHLEQPRDRVRDGHADGHAVGEQRHRAAWHAPA